MAAAAVEVRRATEADLPQVLGLLRASLGQETEHHEAFFRWKHLANPFGPSPSWVATDDDRIVGFRTFLRWEFDAGDRVVKAVRAVDTATHPEYQGRGIFRALTLRALDELRTEGVAFVFNTPNDQSRPGYLKMGWQQVGRLPVGVLPTSLRWLARGVRSRVPSERWSLPTDVGRPAAEALADLQPVTDRLDSATHDRARGLSTLRTAAFLRWRYAGFDPIAYRALPVPSDGGDGLVLFRLRRRGQTTEAIIGDVLCPGAARVSARRMLARLGRASGADVVLGLRGSPSGSTLVPFPRIGPILTTRALAEEAPPLRLVLGDIELL